MRHFPRTPAVSFSNIHCTMQGEPRHTPSYDIAKHFVGFTGPRLGRVHHILGIAGIEVIRRTMHQAATATE